MIIADDITTQKSIIPNPKSIPNISTILTTWKAYSLKKINRFLFLRFTIFGIIIFALVILNQNKSIYNPNGCITDNIHNQLQYFNNLVNEAPIWRTFLQISSSELMDLIFLITFIHWLFKTSNCRIFMSVAIFYGTRAICQMLFKLAYPPGYLWPYPGISSIVVPYGQTSDFFYSGHIGFLLLCLLEYHANKIKKLLYINMMVIIYMIFVMLIFRVHYSFDITTGIIFAHYFFKIVSRNLELFDRFWINLHITLGCISHEIFQKLRFYTISTTNTIV